jgi:primosomal protein N''
LQLIQCRHCNRKTFAAGRIAKVASLKDRVLAEPVAVKRARVSSQQPQPKPVVEQLTAKQKKARKLESTLAHVKQQREVSTTRVAGVRV